MKAVFARGALADLDAILKDLNSVNPFAAAAVEQKIRTTIGRIEQWPLSARAVTQWMEEVRVTPVIRYPYLVFYRVKNDRIEILHVRHTARAAWRGRDS